MLNLPSHAFKYGILAAVSGGADSTALLHWLVQACPADGKLAAAHVHHGLRGDDADNDAAFVRRLAAEYGLPYFEHRLEPAGKSLSENSARKQRYHFLIQKTEQAGFRFLATAHTADDQTETVLHRIMRGTGLTGLAGIASVRQMTPAVTLIRPLLHVRKKTITVFLESFSKNFCNDKTNTDCQFTRNRIRCRMLPALRKEFNPNIGEAVNRLAALAEENETVLTELFSGIIDTAIIRQNENEMVLGLPPVSNFSLPVLRELLVRIWKRQGYPLREMGYAQWSAAAGLIQTGGGRLDLPGGISLNVLAESIEIVKKKKTC